MAGTETGGFFGLIETGGVRSMKLFMSRTRLIGVGLSIFYTDNKAGYTATSCRRVGRGGNARFPTFRLDGYGQTDGPTDRRTDGQTDGRTDGEALLCVRGRI